MAELVISIGNLYRDESGEERRVTNYNGYTVWYRTISINKGYQRTEQCSTNEFRKWAKEAVAEA